jgi:cell wall-associated NlpC family hydrolase
MSEAGALAWVNDYVGVPYVENGRDRDGWDCWGLVLAVYRDRLGLDLPDWRWSQPFGPLERLRAFRDAVDDGACQATELVAPEDYAIALVHAERDRPHHVGIVVGFGVLHAGRYGGTVYEPLGRFLSVYSRCKWFRWRA